MTRFHCPYFKGYVEWTDERERHATQRHPDLLPEHRDLIAQTLADPDQVRRSARFPAAYLLSRWYPDLHAGKHVVVVVMDGSRGRRWIITAYVARTLTGGTVEWKRS